MYAAAPAGFSDRLVASGLNLPTKMEFAPDGRLFVSEKDGMIRVIEENGTLLPAPFASLSVNSEGERGLLGIAFDPNFASNRYLYVFYTTGSEPVHNRVSRLTADPSNPDRMLAGSELPILDLERLSTVSHNGGALGFGPDGKLYVSTGDNYYPHLAQSLTSRFGKILRINPDGTIPADNPFYNTEGAYREIWALGLRNPFSFAFSPPSEQGNTLMYINDVGQDSWEEINLGSMRANYGWPSCEGSCPDPIYADPISYYPHPSDGSGSSIAGGAFYTASQFPSEYRGSYFFGDYAAGFIKRLTSDNQIADFLANINSPVDVKVGPADGYLYYLSIGLGQVHRVQYTTQGNYDPVAVLSANQTSGLPPLTIGFDASRSTDTNNDLLSYTWDFGDGSSSAGAQTIHTYNETGPYVATLTAADGRGGVSSASADIVVGNPPMGTILSPSEGTRYNAGDIISFSGSAINAEDGATMSASAFHWTILFHHNTHTHPFQEFDGVTSGSFTIPTVGETDGDVWYRIYLTVTDSSGLTHTSTRDVLPNKSRITLDSNVTGLEVLLDGQPHATPYSFVGVVGMQRSLEAPAMQVLNGQSHNFQSWSDRNNGGDSARSFVIPSGDAATVTAYYGAGSVAPQHTITIRSAEITGTVRSGYYAAIESSSGAILGSGYTPLNFTGYDATKYTITTSDYRNATFDHWDDGSTSRVRTITLNSNTTLTGYFRTLGNTSPPTTNTTTNSSAPVGNNTVVPPMTAPPAPLGLTVSSADIAGNVLTGHYTTIDTVGDNQRTVQSGYTSLTYRGGTLGSSYRVTPNDVGDMKFDHWEDGYTNRTRIVALYSNTTVTAFFKNVTQTDPPVQRNDMVSTNAIGSPSGNVGGSSGGGGGNTGGSGSGSTTGEPAPTNNNITYSDAYFVSNPLAKIQLQSSNLVGGPGDANQVQAKSKEQVTIATSLKNYQYSEQNFTLITETLDEEGVTTDISLVTGKLSSGESMTATVPLATGEQGSYLVKILVWDNLSQAPIPLSEVTTRNFVVS